MFNRLSLACALAFVFPVSAAAQTAQDVINALGIPQADIQSVGLQLGNTAMLGTAASQGTITAFDGSMGYIGSGDFSQLAACTDVDNGVAGDGGDTVRILVELTTPQGMNSFAFNSYFLTREYPSFVGSEYNDSFQVQQDSAAYTGNIVFDLVGNLVNVNSALFVVTDPALLAGTGFDCAHGGGGTGWVQTISPATPGETFTLTFVIGDVMDGIYDSGVFLDTFLWLPFAPPAPCTAHVGDDACGDYDDSFPDDDDDMADDDDTADEDGVDDDDTPVAPEEEEPNTCATLSRAGGSVSAIWLAGMAAVFARRRL